MRLVLLQQPKNRVVVVQSVVIRRLRQVGATKAHLLISVV
ncbi:hypothetical protein V6Z11_A05G342100 [Gossypium hirsutum]